MFSDPMLDPMGSLITELRNDHDVAALVGNRVRGIEPAPPAKNASGRVIAEGDVRKPSDWVPFIVLVNAGMPPDPFLPITFGTIYANCYGTTGQNASAVYGALVKALHQVGPRVKTNGLGIYVTEIVDGGEQEKDPDTSQPVVRATISLIATTQVVTP
jgi:hypothetical protein